MLLQFASKWNRFENILLAEWVSAQELLLYDANQVTVLLKRANYDLSLAQIPNGLWNLLHDLERIGLQNLLDQYVDWVLPLGDEFVEHLDVLLVFPLLSFFLSLLVFWVLAFFGLLALEVFDDLWDVGVFLQLRGLAHVDDLLEWAFVGQQLVEGLEAKQADLIILRILNKTHDDRPK
jgi:hypothetical protein